MAIPFLCGQEHDSNDPMLSHTHCAILRVNRFDSGLTKGAANQMPCCRWGEDAAEVIVMRSC